MKHFKEGELNQILAGDNRPMKTLYNACFKKCVEQLSKDSACSYADAEDIVMDSMLVLRDKIISGDFINTNVQGYLITVAKNRLRNKLKRDLRLVKYDPEHIETLIHKAPNSPENDYDSKRILIILNGIDKLSKSCQLLLTKNLVEGKSLRNLIEPLGYSNYDVIKSTKSRCMKKLRAIIKESMI